VELVAPLLPRRCQPVPPRAV